MASRDVIVAFDDIVHNTANVYSSSFVELPLGELESIALQVIAEPIGTAPDNVTVQIEMSADGRNWISKNTSAEVFMNTPGGVVSNGYGCDPGLLPSLALVRLRVQLGGAAGCTARISVYARQGPNLGFLPSRLPGCMLWVRADLGVTISGTSNVSAWADQSGNGRTLTASVQPTFAPTGMNGLPALSFAQASRQIIFSPVNYSFGGAASIFSAVSPVAASFANTRIFETNSANGYYLGTGGATGASWRAIINSINGTLGGTTVNGNYIISLNYDGTTGNVYQNGSQIASDAYTTPTSNSNPLAVGGHAGGTNTPDFWNGYIAEVAFYNRALTTAEILQMHRYLGARYAIPVP